MVISMPSTNTVLPTPIVVTNDVPDTAPSYVSQGTGSKAWDLAEIQVGDARIAHDVWQRENGEIYGSTRADFGNVSVAQISGAESIHVHGTEAVEVRRSHDRGTTVLTITLDDGKKVDVFLHGEHGSDLVISETVAS